MAILSKGTTFADNNQVTADSLNNLVDAAVFDDAVDGVSLTKLTSGKLSVADGGITKAKIENLANMKTLGNVSGSSAAPAEVAILDEDNMASNSATSLATQQSIKAYADSKVDGTGAGSFTTLAASGDVTFDTTTLKIDSSNNRVGIGTASPASMLHISGNDPQIRLVDTDTAANSRISASSSVGGIFLMADQDNAVAGSVIGFYVDGSIRATIDSDGDLGIGTTNPNERLTVSGNASITGSISKGSGSFKIDHPLDSKKDTHNLVHSFLEGPQADLIYRGTVDLVEGAATVNIDTASGMTDGTFVLLCREVQSFTTNESGWTAVKSSVSGNVLTIEAQSDTCTDSISWMVVGERQDQHMYEAGWTDENGKVIVEPLIPAEE